MNVILLGVPGSGKGTQSRLISERFGLTVIASGRILRDCLKNDHHDVGGVEYNVRLALNSGVLVSDELVIKLLTYKIHEYYKQPNFKGFVFDGFPRNIHQARVLDVIMSNIGQTIKCVIEIIVPDQVVVERLKDRVICSNCEAVYNLKYKPSSKLGLCDICNAEITKRDDDNSEVIMKRLNSDKPIIKNLVEYYNNNKFYVIKIYGFGETSVIFSEIENHLSIIIDRI